MIKICEYDSSWPTLYKSEAKKLAHLLSDELKEIFHIGSTAIPQMSAKPVIDIMLGVEDIFDIEIVSKKLSTLGYEPLTRQFVPHVSFFAKRQDGEMTYHVHLHEVGSPQIKRHVNFRDYMIEHDEYASEYANLKYKLAEAHADDRKKYVEEKSHFVQMIDAQAKKWEGRRRDFLPQNTGQSIAHWNKEKLIKAAVANFNCNTTHFPQFLDQIELLRVPGYTVINSKLSDDTFNLIIDADFEINEAEKKIRELTQYFTKHELEFSWWLGPTDQPAVLDRHLESAGYQNMETNPIMYIDLDAWNCGSQAIPELEIIQAKNEKSLVDYASVLMNDEKSFKQYYAWIASVLDDEDPLEYYVGYINGKPVVRGMSCYFSQAVGLYWLSTAVDERRKGYGQAMQEFRLKKAKEKNYHIALLQASEEGYPLYKKMGYQVIGEYKDYQMRIQKH